MAPTGSLGPHDDSSKRVSPGVPFYRRGNEHNGFVMCRGPLLAVLPGTMLREVWPQSMPFPRRYTAPSGDEERPFQRLERHCVGVLHGRL